jgi:hypothetical protein
MEDEMLDIASSVMVSTAFTNPSAVIVLVALGVPSLAMATVALASLLVVWWLILYVRPALARQKLRMEAERLRDQAVDAYLSGELDDSEHYKALLLYCHVLTDHTNEITFGRWVSFALACRKVGLTPDDWHTVQAVTGRPQLIAEYDEQLDSLVADYLIKGSRVWVVAAPLQYLFRLIKKGYSSAGKELEPPREVSPSKGASHFRETVETAVERTGAHPNEVLIGQLTPPSVAREHAALPI